MEHADSRGLALLLILFVGLHVAFLIIAGIGNCVAYARDPAAWRAKRRAKWDAIQRRLAEQQSQRERRRASELAELSAIRKWHSEQRRRHSDGASGRSA